MKPNMTNLGRYYFYAAAAAIAIAGILHTRVPNPITGGRASQIIPLGIATKVFEFIYVGIIAFILSKRGGMTTKQKQQLR